MTNSFDPTKPVRTRDGKKARIIDTDFSYQGNSLIIAAVLLDKNEVLRYHNKDGGSYGLVTQQPTDLVNYNPFEITDEEAELIIDLYGACIGQNLSDSFKRDVRDRHWSRVGGICLRFRDIIIKHRKTK